MSTTSDKELLELAAKAAGLKCHAYVDSELSGRGINTGELETPLWNPLTDDGDALRLAVKLCIFVRPEFVLAKAIFAPDRIEVSEVIQGDEFAATRRAIVRAAAEIARKP